MLNDLKNVIVTQKMILAIKGILMRNLRIMVGKMRRKTIAPSGRKLQMVV
jgi:hypothetical protein